MATLLFSLTQATVLGPNRQGDYYSNDAPAKGTASSPLMPGSLWVVKTASLNCRRAPGSEHPVVKKFQQGTVLQAEVYRGGSDEVLLNAKDTNGKPWMPVRGKSLEEQCYVRANSRYIQPAPAQPTP